MQLVVYAPVWGQSGFEQVSRGLLLALDQIGVQIELRSAEEWNQERVGLMPSVASRLERMIQQRVDPLAPHVIYQVPRGQVIHERAPAVCYSLFETDRCPQGWVDPLSKMDRVLVFSEFNRKGWAESGIPRERIGLIPPAVDATFYAPEGPKLEVRNRRGFTFLTSGDFTERKNFEAVVEAYVTEFSNGEPVTLIVKCHYGGFTKRFRRDCYRRLHEIAIRFNSKNPPRILFWGEKVTNEAMAALYRSADCFVLASRGEGLGLQYLEAMASGVPVIHCGWSAHADYLNQDNSYPVAYNLKVIDDPNFIVKCPQALNHRWAQVDVGDLARAMRHVVENHGEAREKAAKALAWVRRQTWQRAAVAFVSEILHMYDPLKAKKQEEEPAYA